MNNLVISPVWHQIAQVIGNPAEKISGAVIIPEIPMFEYKPTLGTS